ncbi:hypothetical protein DC366_07755 [Pelagivirga sediminicola]|uniref:PAS domain-containing protein n=1 Tax=Pelagivirga sediminicola TaxID=2170575 RepID=A0A2T7G8L9_9RHOB|nr:PAS-domain containing protein [Pelagivirga sediminicola]PVA10759.1 hypothetical protein DC366_07755 [Pelagivirga sediminicola]
MAVTSWMLWIELTVLAATLSFCVLWLIGRWAPSTRRAGAAVPPGNDTASYLFQDDLMFDHHAGAVPAAKGDTLCWPDLRGWLEDRFDGLPLTLTELEKDKTLTARPVDDGDTAELQLLRTEHGTRITLRDAPHGCPAERHQMLLARSHMQEAAEALLAAPIPIWKTSPDGAVIWKNAACEAAFDPASQAVNAPEPDQTGVTRFSIVEVGRTRATWYEAHSAAGRSEVLHHAIDITKIVTAEAMQKDFVQTLTKTFAYLTTGLAVFDRNRKLALFNPALVDLTSLPVQFLSGRPDLMAFFDNLRNRSVMPEPRSYASWRSQIGDVIESAEGGLYEETWSLPNDVTYRVTGRPHPDGAVAFLFEDISADVMTARRSRTQVDMRQSALDRLSDAVMVIGADNVLAFCNTAATRLLGIDPDTCFADMTVTDLMRACAAALPSTAGWRDVEAALRARSQEGAVRGPIEIADGAGLTGKVELLPGGARMLTLSGQRHLAPPIPARAAAG